MLVNTLLHNQILCWDIEFIVALPGNHSYYSVVVQKPCWMDGWVDGWMDRWKSRVKDCLQQSKNVRDKKYP